MTNNTATITTLVEAFWDLKNKFKHCDISNVIGEYYLKIATIVDETALEQCEQRTDQGIPVVRCEDFQKYVTPTDKINTALYCVQALLDNVDIPRFTSHERFLSNDYKVSKIILQIHLLLKELAEIEEIKSDTFNELIELLVITLPELTAEFLKKNFIDKKRTGN